MQAKTLLNSRVREQHKTRISFCYFFLFSNHLRREVDSNEAKEGENKKDICGGIM